MEDREPAKRKPGRPRIPAEQQRQRLLDAADQIFEAVHYDRANVQDVVKAAGMSSRSFYECFESKEELVVVLAKERGNTFIAGLEETVATARADNLAQAVGDTLRVFLEDLPAVLVDLVHTRSGTGEKIEEIRNQMRERIMQTLLSGMIRMAKEGELPVAPNPMALSIVLAGIEGTTLRYLAERRRDELLALHPELLAGIRALFPEQLG